MCGFRGVGATLWMGNHSNLCLQWIYAHVQTSTHRRPVVSHAQLVIAETFLVKAEHDRFSTPLKASHQPNWLVSGKSMFMQLFYTHIRMLILLYLYCLQGLTAFLNVLHHVQRHADLYYTKASSPQPATAQLPGSFRSYWRAFSKEGIVPMANEKGLIMDDRGDDA